VTRKTFQILAAAIAFAVLTAVPASASAAPSVSVSPATGLVDLQVVDLSWSGFTPNLPVYVRMCKRGTSSTSDCAVPAGDLDHFTASSDGGGVVRYILAEKDFGPFQCDDENACDIVALQNPADLASGAVAQLTFATPPQACPAADGLPLSGEGASAAAYTMYAWEAAACQLESHLNVTYTNINSFDATDAFVAGTTDFAVSGFSLTSAQASSLHGHDRDFAYAPLTLTGVALGFNIIDQGGHQITHLVLTPKIVAEIATGELSTFDCPRRVSDDDCVNLLGGDPAIRELNPNIKFPDGPVHFAIRAEHSASNVAFTTWLSQNAPSVWTYGVSSTWPPPDPHACHICPPGIQGEDNTGRAVGFPPTYTPSDVYVGEMDSTYAYINDVPTVNLVNPGQPDAGVAPNAAGLAAAVAAGHREDDGTVTPDYTTSDPDAYPMPMLTYAVVPTSQGYANFSADDGKTLKAFLQFAVGDGQSHARFQARVSALSLPAGSAPLPADLVAETQQVAGQIPTTKPTGGGGGHHHHNTNGGGNDNNGNGGDFGGGNPIGGGTFPGGSTGSLGSPPPSGSSSPPPSGGSPPPGDSSSSPSDAAITPIDATLATPTSSAIVPALIGLAVIALLVGPALLLLARRKRRATPA
jgi:phosphate transport system substrate-binding protein